MKDNYDLMLSGVDEEIRDLVDVLNKGGFETVASCCGHNNRPANIALKDGREIIIARNFDEARLMESVIKNNIHREDMDLLTREKHNG